jgi:hypothetical protein
MYYEWFSGHELDSTRGENFQTYSVGDYLNRLSLGKTIADADIERIVEQAVCR